MTRETGRRVVVGVDFSKSGDVALAEALRMLSLGHISEVHSLHVLDPRDVVADHEHPVLQTEEEVLERAPTILRERALELALDLGLEVDGGRVFGHARIGQAAETLCQFAVDYEAALMVVGTHGRRGVDRVMLGSVAERLVRAAPCPVLVARPYGYEGVRKTELPAEPYPEGRVPEYREPPRDVASRRVSVEIDSWRPSDNGPTGYRIV